jgi:lipopolysaccharide transport system ATP-binding protein
MIPATKHGDRLLRLENVGVSYRRRGVLKRQPPFWALEDVFLEIYRGETLGIIGRNGVGKSTLLRLLAGIIIPDRGIIHFDSPCHISLLSLQVGFIPQLTGRENAVLSGMLLGMRRKEIEARMDKIIDFAELGDFFDQPISTYSTGMRARLGFSVAFQTDPDILLVDEVLGVGDAEFREKSERAMRQKIRSNRTVVLVSHNPQMIRNLCDRAVWIENGCTRLEGDPESVLTAYSGNLKSA